jgi:hypothetical protein
MTETTELARIETAAQPALVSVPCEWGDTYWVPKRSLSYDEYERVFLPLRQLRNEREREMDTLLWWLSDVMNNGEMDLGEAFYQMVDAKGYVKESLIKIRRVGEEFGINERFSPREQTDKKAGGKLLSGVSFWTHWEVRRLGKRDRKRLLKKYREDPDFSRDDLRDEVKAILEAEEAAQSGRQDALDFGDDGEGGEGGGSGEDLPDCPLCDGAGKVTHARRDAYLQEEGVLTR